MHIEQEGTCQYEATVRRRGKGKKTLQKEQEERLHREMQNGGNEATNQGHAAHVVESPEYYSGRSSTGSLMQGV